ncbi:SRPBCC family protein [Actinoplanes sp. CA-030573]|uniref:SRPBCC family protein n=1 Tax=Actinoplanes sp. CA-030573 TaxID=3239898 RepID=UPI003D8C4E50
MAVDRVLTVCGPRAADDVWDRYVRPRRWPEWSPQIRAVSYPAATLHARTSGVVVGPAGVRVGFRVLEIDATGPVRSWSWSASVAGVRLYLRHTVEAVPGGTRTGLMLRGFAPAVLLYLPLARLALRRLVR